MTRRRLAALPAVVVLTASPAPAATTAQLRPLPAGPWGTGIPAAPEAEGEMGAARLDVDAPATLVLSDARANAIILLRRGTVPRTLPAPDTVAKVAVADVTGDGRSDIIASSDLEIRIVTATGEVATTTAGPGCVFGAVRPVAVRGELARRLAVGFGCGVAPSGVTGLRVYRVNPTGQAAVTQDLPDGGGWRMATGDLDGDGSDDLLAVHGRRLQLSRSSADGFVSSASFPAPAAGGARDVAIGDVDGDGRLDVAVLGTGVHAPSSWTESPSPYAGVAVLRGTGTGELQRPSTATSVDDEVYRLAVGDLDGDRRAEIIAPSMDRTSWGAVLRWTAPGRLHPVGALQGVRPVVADLDGNGHLDVATLNPAGSSVIRAWTAVPVTAGTARLVVPRRCVGSHPVKLVIRGSRIRSVAYRVGGAAISPTAGPPQIKVGPSRFTKRGTRVTATVAFTTFQRPATLTARLRRCTGDPSID